MLCGGSLFFGSLRSVLGPSLEPALNALAIQRAADNVIADAGQVLHAAPANKDDGVLLQIVPDPRDIACDFYVIGQPDSGHFSHSGVRLFGRRRENTGADASLLRTPVQRGRLAFIFFRRPAFSDELIDSRQ